jgi:hypothetical protein
MTVPTGTVSLRFKSKIDAWVKWLWLGSIGVAVWSAFQEPNQPVPVGFEIGLRIFVAGFVAFMLWIYYGTWYELTDTHLLIRSGPLRVTISLATIESVEPTRSPLSSPALSLDRLRIRYDRYGFTMISPEHRDRFMAELMRREPALKPVGGGRLQRTNTLAGP